MDPGPAGTFHDFHNAWIIHLKEALNAGILPADYYAQSEQRAAEIVADVLALRHPTVSTTTPDRPSGVAVTEAPPQVTRTMPADGVQAIGLKQRRLVVRHVSRHEVVALIEIVSPANKDRPTTVASFVRKTVDAIEAGVHLLMVDLFPNGRHVPNGLHRAIWDNFGEEYLSPSDRQLIVVAYEAASLPVAYLEPLAVGDALPTMPLFLTPGRYVNVPLEPSYEAVWRGVSAFWRAVVEGRESSPEPPETSRG